MTARTCIGFVREDGLGVVHDHPEARPCGHVLMDPVPGFDTYYCEGCGREWQRRYVENPPTNVRVAR